MSLWTRFFCLAVRYPVFWFFWLFYRLRIEGVERLPAGGALILANHQSFLDPALIQIALRRLVIFTPRDTLQESLVFRLLSLGLALVPVRRGEGNLEASRRLIGLLQSGQLVAMFPEQTRTRDGCLAPLKPGFHLIASRAKVPIVPLRISGAFEAWPRGRKLPRLGGEMTLTVGPPLDLSGVRRAEAIRRVEQALWDLGVPKAAEPAPVPASGSASGPSLAT